MSILQNYGVIHPFHPRAESVDGQEVDIIDATASMLVTMCKCVGDPT